MPPTPFPPGPAPLVSVIVPAFAAHAHVAGAVASALAGGISEHSLEILVESDDGSDYAALSALSPAVRPAATGAVRTGAGATRNRAMARARGAYLAFLDADDLLDPGWLAALLPLARAEGAAVSPLVVEEAGAPLLHLWQPAGPSARLSLADLCRSGASVRGMVARALCPPFADALAQDILHMVQVMARAGGSLPLSRVPYRLRLTPASVTDAADFGARVHLAYLAHVETLARDAGLAPALAAQAAEVFRAKIALNAEHAARGRGESYYAFIAGRLGDAPEGDGTGGRTRTDTPCGNRV